MERTIKKAGKELLAGVRLFDVYEGDKIAAGKKQLAWSLTFRAADRTLKDAEVSEVFDAIVAGLGKDHGAALRS